MSWLSNIKKLLFKSQSPQSTEQKQLQPLKGKSKVKGKIEEIAQLIEEVYEEGHLTETTCSKLLRYSDVEIHTAEAYYRITSGYSFPPSVWNLSDEDRLIIWSMYITGINASLKQLMYDIQHTFDDKYGEKSKKLLTDRAIPDKVLDLYKRVCEAVSSNKESLFDALIDEIEDIKRRATFTPYRAFLDDLILSMRPKKRQRINGVERAKKAYRHLLYDIQKELMMLELMDISSSLLGKLLMIMRDEHRDRAGLIIKNNRGCCDYCSGLESKDYGYGPGFIPWFEVPIPKPHRYCSCLFIQAIR